MVLITFKFIALISYRLIPRRAVEKEFREMIIEDTEELLPNNSHHTERRNQIQTHSAPY